jgi:hypothetical protein
MVAPEPGDSLLLYIMVIVDTVSMVLVMERPEPCQPQEPKAEEALGSQHPEPPSPQALKLCDGTNIVAESQPSEANPGPDN